MQFIDLSVCLLIMSGITQDCERYGSSPSSLFAYVAQMWHVNICHLECQIQCCFSVAVSALLLMHKIFKIQIHETIFQTDGGI